MEFKFSPAFEPLIKFTKGLPKVPTSEDDIVAVANYLGVDVPDATLDDGIKLLSDELSFQNGFLSTELSSDAIYNTQLYRRSKFIREIVANNRINLRNRMNPDR